MRQKVKKLLITLLTVVVLLGMIPCETRAAETKSVTLKSGDPSTGNVTDGDTITLTEYTGVDFPDGGNYYLTRDLTVSSRKTIIDQQLNLDLNGHTITFASGSGSAVVVNNNSIFNLFDSDGNGSINVGNNTAPSNDDYRHGGFVRINSGTFNMYGGVINGGTVDSTAYGGIVYIAGTSDTSTFNLYAGKLTGSSGGDHGGGVQVSAQTNATYAARSQFYMYGGEISGNSSKWGGGIGIYGKAYIFNGEIKNNSANGGGGGIELEKGGRLYMYGGSVTENRITEKNSDMYKGGGIHVPNGSEFHIKGNVTVKDNYEGGTGSNQNNTFVRKEAADKVILDGALNNTTKIGLQTNGSFPFVLCSNFISYNNPQDANDCFSSDKSGTFVTLDSSGKLILADIVPDKPTIDPQPKGGTIRNGEQHLLSVEASITDDGTLSYQWYKATSQDGAGVAIDGATNNSYNTSEEGYYYCVVTNTLSGIKTLETSERAQVTFIVVSAAVPADIIANDRTYDETNRPLVNVTGEATGGVMYYALGVDADTPPADELYTISVPAATNAGTYYVWYKAAGDENHTDSEPACITASIQKAEFTPFVRINNWTVGEEPATPVLEDNIGNGEPTYTYALKGTEEFIASVPVDAGQYILKARIEETDNYKSAEAVCSFVILEADHQHAFGSDPSWLWRFIDGKAYAEATYRCICGETETVATDVVKSAENDSRVTYTATGRNGIPDTHTFNKTFTVTYNNKGTEYEYGATCSLTAETASDWTVTAGSSSVVRAEGTKTFYFTVTENVTVEAKESEAAQQSAKIDVSSYVGGTKQFTYKVFWSLPEGAQVKSTMIYRSKDNGFELNTADRLLEATSLRSYDMKLHVRNGEFKYTASNLTSKTKQTVMAQVVYSLNGETFTIHTEPLNIAIQ